MEGKTVFVCYLLKEAIRELFPWNNSAQEGGTFQSNTHTHTRAHTGLWSTYRPLVDKAQPGPTSGRSDIVLRTCLTVKLLGGTFRTKVLPVIKRVPPGSTRGPT